MQIETKSAEAICPKLPVKSVADSGMNVRILSTPLLTMPHTSEQL